MGNYQIGVGGDLIVAIDGRPAQDTDDLQREMSRKRIGDVMELTIYRNGRTMRVKVTLGAAAETL